MKAIAWLIVAGIGIGLSVWAYRAERPTELTPISSGMIVAARSSAQRFDQSVPYPTIKARMLSLPVMGISAMLGMWSGGGGEAGRGLRFQLAEKLIQVSLRDVGIQQSSLAWGKLPRMERNEVLAGAEAAHQDRFEIDGTDYKITGGLGREAGLFTRCYVLPEADRSGEHGDEGDSSFRAALLIPMDAWQLARRQTDTQLDGLFPAKEFDRVSCVPSTSPRAFSLILLGQGLLLLGGSGFLIALYAAAASRVRWSVLRDPLVALSTHRRLNWGGHLSYFGLYLVTACLVYRTPDVHNAMQAIMQGQLRHGSGLLHFAANAYLTGNIAWAALVTFAINFVVGSLAFLTLPSCVVPGSGVILAVVRAVSWGLLLGPATWQQALVMLPHSGTLLLEGEGYILATFFGLMMARLVFGRESTTSARLNYTQGLLLNLKGSVLVALVLAVAAVYESTEVIWMMKHLGTG
jgi:hypothetical protein